MLMTGHEEDRMKLNEARSILNEQDQNSVRYMREWGLSTIREAIRTVLARRSATQEDKELAWKISDRIATSR
jgi:hypothetical protein